MIALVFLNPLLLWGLPLIAVPIVIHLMNRRRFNKRPWAAMEFLLRAMKRNRRRLRMEQWLVLLLRTLAVLLLILLVTRPRLTGGMLGSDIGHHVLCLDDSASMAHRGGADDAMDRAMESAVRIATGLAEERAGDLFTLVLASLPDQPILAAIPVGSELPRRVREAVAGLHAGDLALDLGVLLPELGAQANKPKDASRSETLLITDLRRHDWTASTGDVHAALTTWLTSLDPETERLEVIDVGSRSGENLGVAEVRCSNRVATAGVPLSFEVVVRNFGRAESSPCELSIDIDGKSRPMQSVPAISPGSTTTVGFSETFHIPDWHAVRAVLPTDRYAVDDSRSLAFEVRPNSRVILIDGALGEDVEQSETYYIAVALDQRGDASTGIDVRIHPDHDFVTLPDEEVDGADLLVFANVGRFSPEAVARAEAFANSGGGVVIWLGEQIDVANYDQLLWKGGRGLLPLPILSVAGDLDHPKNIHLVDDDTSLFNQARDELRTWFAQLVLVGRWFTLKESPATPADIALRVGDADGEPLLASRNFGDGGRVHVIATTADATWTDWPRWPPYLITVEQIWATSARPQDFAHATLLPTGTFRTEVDPAKHRPDVELRPVAGDGDVLTFAAPPAANEVVGVDVPMRELTGYGVFVVARKTHAGGEDLELLARNPLLEESDLDPITASNLLAAVPDELRDRFDVREGVGGGAGIDVGGGRLWRMLGFLMLGAMLAESLLAWRFGRR